MEVSAATSTNAEPDPSRGVYAISVAAQLVGMGSQTLRLYERRGLLEPARSDGALAATAATTWTGYARSPIWSLQA
jgi:hypothetical protein